MRKAWSRVFLCGALLAPGSALATESADTTAEGVAARQPLRTLALAGRGAEARALIVERLGHTSEAEAAALVEILTVADAWSGVGRPAPIEVPVPVSGGPDWIRDLDAARVDLARGAYRAAILRIERLYGTTTDLVSAARANEIRALAHAALESYGPSTAPAAAPDKTAPREESRWYGWQTLITDGVATLALPAMPAASLGLYSLGGPIVHAAHGNVGKAFGSLGLRLALPLVGAAVAIGVGCQGDQCKGDFGGAVYGAVGLGLGAIGAIVIDSAALAHEKVESPRTVARLRPIAGPRREGGFDLGVGGTW